MSFLREVSPPNGTETVFALLRDCGPLSRPEIARRVPMSIEHASTAAEWLANGGRARRRQGRSSGGPTLYEVVS